MMNRLFSVVWPEDPLVARRRELTACSDHYNKSCDLVHHLLQIYLADKTFSREEAARFQKLITNLYDAPRKTAEKMEMRISHLMTASVSIPTTFCPSRSVREVGHKVVAIDEERKRHKKITDSIMKTFVSGLISEISAELDSLCTMLRTKEDSEGKGYTNLIGFLEEPNDDLKQLEKAMIAIVNEVGSAYDAQLMQQMDLLKSTLPEDTVRQIFSTNRRLS
ncbi:MAG TPA: hypothetical protein VNC84_02355 [Gammaproteobacteria bacterium]|jgi:molecular chaperone GrpE (heat shock protein)|nr:hypothetical protein [Gammaproteobacteria bacterium]